MVYDPVYYLSESPNRKEGPKYDMCKIYWVDDKGKKFMKKTKTFGQLGLSGMEKSVVKLFSDYFTSSTDISWDVKSKHGLTIDLVANIDDESMPLRSKR